MSQTYHPTTRVLALLELLQTHGRLGGAELTSMLEIDRRSLRRYIVNLEEMGIPIMTERGRYGGYALIPGFKLPPLMFNEDEAFALTIGLLAAGKLKLVDIAPAVASANAKLQRILPDKLKQRLSATGNVLELDLKQAALPADKEMLAIFSECRNRQQRVHLHYARPDGKSSERDFDIYGLAFHAGYWYLAGMCHLRRDVRSFRLDRVVRVEVLPQTYTCPPDFDVLHYLRKANAVIPRTHSVEVMLKTDMANALSYVSDAIAVLEQTDGGVMLYNQSEDLDWFARILAGLPFEFEIRKPVQLRDELAKLAGRLLQATSH
ncbi:YafY family protein [Undibacterium sp. TS12]|uniref:helix-turn-helix transcriptional regulator n=1 Tax=Undibacterium sp. TS12 TaxID=2908202 RepID=UPI001F4C8455|nr:YafY family protein [Undibacterium sp. TS12]MCH8618563.1 YafY family transcriptional regulator [Undibacterium sp. TS12]